MKQFDIVLVFGYFRSATPFLSIIRFLGKELRIAVLAINTDPRLEAKTSEAHLLFMRLCQEFGAQVLEFREIAQAKLMVVHQFPYPDEHVRIIRGSIRAAQTLGLMTLAVAGIEKHDRFLRQFEIKRVTVPDKEFADYLIALRGSQTRYAGIDMVEVGLPFRKYPVFDDFAADWIVAAPTLFSFTAEVDKQRFLRDLLKLMKQIPQTDLVAYKPHNGNARDYFTPRLYTGIARLIAWMPGIERMVEGMARRLPRGLKIQASRTLTALLHARVTRRAIAMRELTPFSEMSLEAFLPGVRKGVIGGLSNTIWGSLFFDLPYYNCVSPDERAGGRSELLKKNGDQLLSVNLGYFGVPYCNGMLDRGVKDPKIVFDPSRHHDLMTLLADICQAEGSSPTLMNGG